MKEKMKEGKQWVKEGIDNRLKESEKNGMS